MALESITLYKLMILYMLNKVNFPLTTSQLSSFLLDKLDSISDEATGSEGDIPIILLYNRLFPSWLILI